MAQVPIPDTTLIAELYMLDTSGSDLYKESLAQYWSGVYFAMLVFDVTSPESFESCKQWNDEIKKNRREGRTVPSNVVSLCAALRCQYQHGGFVMCSPAWAMIQHSAEPGRLSGS